MAKKVAVLAVDPVNGFGLFAYLETFFENGISYRTFAVAEGTQIKTNSGVTLTVDDVVANLKGKEHTFDALVFACGDAIPQFAANAGKSYNQEMLSVMKTFADSGKLLIGHCGAGVLFDSIASLKGKRVALHPYVKNAVKNVIGTDQLVEIDGNLYTAQTEHALAALLPEVVKALK
ncbi:MAG: DJ-1/PfpI family protein [Prevotellaceae bacterium]|jgi:putative intracellular protease/amidase|nr:DJ-1/PfpI family protein [Prevotellaceae bacterium]